MLLLVACGRGEGNERLKVTQAGIGGAPKEIGGSVPPTEKTFKTKHDKCWPKIRKNPGRIKMASQLRIALGAATAGMSKVTIGCLIFLSSLSSGVAGEPKQKHTSEVWLHCTGAGTSHFVNTDGNHDDTENVSVDDTYVWNPEHDVLFEYRNPTLSPVRVTVDDEKIWLKKDHESPRESNGHASSSEEKYIDRATLDFTWTQREFQAGSYANGGHWVVSQNLNVRGHCSKIEPKVVQRPQL
jgi:hypothetical protein